MTDGDRTGQSTDGTDNLFDGLATEKEVREMLMEVGLQATEHGLAPFAIDTMFEESIRKLRRNEYDRGEFDMEET